MASREHCGSASAVACANGGTCHTERGGVVCVCALGWDGPTCHDTTDAGWGKTVDIMQVANRTAHGAFTPCITPATPPATGACCVPCTRPGARHSHTMPGTLCITHSPGHDTTHWAPCITHLPGR
jgi:hypothetical protein